MQLMLDGLMVGESPRWRNGFVWFAHWGAAELVAFDVSAGEVAQRIPVPTTIPFSIDWTPDGTLLVSCGPQSTLLAGGDSGEWALHADLTAISDKGFNELVVDGRGNAYVNGPGFDLMAGEAPKPGIIALLTPDGEARQVADGIGFPNGMAVTPDNGTLIVADSYGRCLTGFTIGDDGGLSERRVWADLGSGVPDGICIDAEGAVWYADVPNRRCVRVREGGQALQTVTLDRGGFSCTLSDDTLFIVAAEWNGPERMFAGPPTGQLLSAPAPAPGAGWP